MGETSIIRGIPDFDGAGVYALIDASGKKYIGSSLNIKKRIAFHESGFRRVLKGLEPTNVGRKLTSAVLSGARFDAVILQKLPLGGCFYDLMDLEKRYLEESGGCNNTYNDVTIKDYRRSDLELLRIWERETTDRATRIADNLRETILKREKPILQTQRGDVMGGKTSAKVKNKWIASAYDRINLTVPKGKKDVIQAHAETQGESVTGFINRAIDNQMERDKEGANNVEP